MRGFSRRDFLKIAGGLAFAATVPFPRPSVSGMLGRIFGSQASETLPITPSDEFYITSYRSPPDVRLHKWVLSIKGLVERPMVLTYSRGAGAALGVRDRHAGVHWQWCGWGGD